MGVGLPASQIQVQSDEDGLRASFLRYLSHTVLPVRPSIGQLIVRTRTSGKNVPIGESFTIPSNAKIGSRCESTACLREPWGACRRHPRGDNLLRLSPECLWRANPLSTGGNTEGASCATGRIQQKQQITTIVGRMTRFSFAKGTLASYPNYTRCFKGRESMEPRKH